MHNRKRLLVGLSFLLLTVMLVGATTAYAAPVKIKVFWNAATVPVYEPIIALFEQEHPDIEVELVGVSYDELVTKALLAVIDPRGEFDVLLADDAVRARLVEEELLVDLYTLGEYDWNNFHPVALSFGTYDGKLYYAPTRLNALGLIYNKKFFREAGIPEPDDDFTLEDMEAAAQKFTTGGKYGFATWYIRSTLSVYPWAALMFTHGGQVLDDKSYPVFNSDAGVKALEQYVRYLQYGPPGMANWDINEVHEAFKQELVGMCWTWGSSFYAVAADPNLSIPGKTGDGEFAPIPKGDVRRGTIVSFYQLCIPLNAPHKEEAWTFLKWILSEKVERMAVELGVQPARTAIMTDPEYLSRNLGFGGLHKAMDAAAEGNMYLPRTVELKMIMDTLAEALSRAVIGEWTPKQALDNAATEIRNTLAKKGYYK